ncbi:testican-2-like [Eucyclogobius newberryi]|uniref:testican-2-like n=1 Tax=Eucyclogobius newberryi TaxID=166745 RepID=UPI003B5C9CFC
MKQEVEDDYIRNTEENLASDETDTTKDPCLSVKCSRHKVCVIQGVQRAVCVNRKKLEHRVKQLESPLSACKACPASSAPVCGSDGHNYASKCKLQQQVCLTGKDLNILCSGFCPCVAMTTTNSQTKQVSCSAEELADLGDRLRDWFQLLHGNNKRNDSSRDGGLGNTAPSALDRSVATSCRDSIAWMFSRLDSSADGFLDRSELESINLDKYEVCVGPFFNSCDAHRDGRVSRAEWCLCFWRDKPPCLAELERIQVQEASKSKGSALFVPGCDEDGYFRKVQCDAGRGECWCVDPHGGELTGTRGHATPDCDEVAGHSGDFGSGVGWDDEEEEAREDAGDEPGEEEEEEEEQSEADDGGYIW